MINPCGVVAAFLKLWQVPEYVDPTEQMDPDFEPMAGEETFMAALASHMPEGVWHRYSVELLKAPNGEVFCDEAYLLPIDSSHAAPPVCDEGPTGVCDIPQSPPVGLPTSEEWKAMLGPMQILPDTPAIQLPMFKASDLEAIAAECIDDICRNPVPLGSTKWSQYVAEIVVSAITYELHGLAFDQSRENPQ